MSRCFVKVLSGSSRWWSLCVWVGPDRICSRMNPRAAALMCENQLRHLNLQPKWEKRAGNCRSWWEIHAACGSGWPCDWRSRQRNGHFRRKPDLTLESEVTPRPAAFCKLIGRHAEQLMCERIRSSRCMCHIWRCEPQIYILPRLITRETPQMSNGGQRRDASLGAWWGG